MKRQAYCKTGYHEDSENSIAPPRWQWLKTCYIALLSLMMLMVVGEVKAQMLSNSNDRIKSFPEEGYVEIEIEYYLVLMMNNIPAINNALSEVNISKLSYTTEGSSAETILNFGSVHDDGKYQDADTWYWWKLYIPNTTGIAKVGKIHAHQTHGAAGWYEIPAALKYKDGKKIDNKLTSPASETDMFDRTSGVIRWYIPKELYGKEIKLYIDKYVDVPGTATDIHLSAEKTIPAFLGVAKIEKDLLLDYSKPGYNTLTVVTDKQLLESQIEATGKFVGKQETTGTKFWTYTLEEKISYVPREIKFNYNFPTTDMSRYPEDVKSNIQEKYIIPAYHWPDTLSPSYDKQTGKVTLTWEINNLFKGEHVKGDGFEVEASLDENFGIPSNIRTVGTVNFDINRKDYSITDNVGDLSNKSHMYYRLRRTRTADEWKWDECRKKSVKLELAEHASIDSVEAKLENNKAKIKWKDKNSYWSDGSLLKIQKWIAGGALIYTEELGETEWKSGEWEDEDISTCTHYVYKLQVVPGVKIFTAEKPTLAIEEVNKPILITDVGTLLSFSASKGYYPDRTTLKWTSNGKFDQFVIKRKGDDGGIAQQIALIDASTSDEYTYDDEKNVAGVYYTYSVVGIINCSGTKTESNQLSDIGFRSPQGNIYGSVTYENGQAVEGVEIRLEQDDNDAAMGSSIKFDASGTDTMRVKIAKGTFTFGNKQFAFQAWISPEVAKPTNQVLFTIPNGYEIGFDAGSKLYFKRENTVLGSVEKEKYTFSANKFEHITATHSADSVFIYIGAQPVLSAQLASPIANNIVPTAFYFGSDTTGTNKYVGHIDEVRIWNCKLDSAIIARDYARLITGNETNLFGYYRFDENIDDAFYDMSYKKEVYNENHGVISSGGSITHDADNIPTPEQLSLKGITNESGNYFINGVPYTGNGTQYKIIPRLGTHQFDPTHHTRFVGGNSVSHEANFKDKSSFPVSGVVYYSGSTVPVQGVMFKIDGIYANDGKGNLTTSDSKGEFSINVPVGYHEVRLEKQGHVFETEGRITDSNYADLNYQKPISDLKLYDATTVRLIGRVAGGAVEEAYPLGHSLSKNNLGDSIKINIELVNSSGRKIVTTDKNVFIDHITPSAGKTKTAKTRAGFMHDEVIIVADNKTGEFYVDLIPENYRIKDVTYNGISLDLFKGKTVDLSQKLALQDEVYEYEYEDKNYSDTVKYNERYSIIHRVDPSASIVQIAKGKELPYFGNDSVIVKNLLGEETKMAVYDDNNSKYVLGKPVLTMGVKYTFKINAFESYVYSGGKQNGTEDRVPTTDGVVKFSNNWKFGAMDDSDNIALDDKGEAHYTFRGGQPNLANGLKTLAAEIAFADKSIAWATKDSKGNDVSGAYILGAVPSGTDIVTKGPERLITVLRDPPGSNSYAYLEKGSTFTNSVKLTETLHHDQSETIEASLGKTIVTSTGVGVEVQNTIDIIGDLSIGFNHRTDEEWGNTITTTNTITSQVSTSADPTYVGADGDLFIGNSTNISYGIAQSLSLVPTKYLEAGETPLVDAGDISIVQRNTFASSMEFATMFAYPQVHIENVLIPNLVKLRNSLFCSPGATETEAQTMANNNNKTVYLSKVDFQDSKFGASNTDKSVFANEASLYVDGNGPSYKAYYPSGLVPDGKAALPDSIHHYNQSIASWYNLLSQNEKAKIDAKDKLDNYTFQAAASIEYSREYAYVESDYSNYEYVLSASVAADVGFNIDGAGVVVSTGLDIGGGKNEETEDTEENTRKEGFVLAEEGTDYLSVDVFYERNPDYDDYLASENINQGTGKHTRKGPFVYRTRGGATSCPYEGAYISKYYKQGTKISEPTMRVEKPQIDTDKKLVNNVPSNRKAVFKLWLDNLSETKDDMYYNLNLLDASNPHGATLAVDGTPLGGAGRVILVPYGERLEKTLEVTRGPEEMNYNDLQLVLTSLCQYDPTDYLEDIADTVQISAQFIPSCSEVHVKAPLDKWVVNTNSTYDATKEVYVLPIVLDEFDVNHKLFDRIELQYKQEDQAMWTTLRTFYIDPNAVKGNNSEAIDLNSPTIKYDFVMDVSDSKYDIRAVSICKQQATEIYTYSNIVSGIKDTKNPQLFGAAQPANGILSIENDILLNFNKIIKEGNLSRENFEVTGIRNGSKSDHSVSVAFDGKTDYISTEAEKNLANKDFTVEMWVYREKKDKAILFAHGDVNESVTFGFDDNNKLELTVGGKTVTSGSLIIQEGQWNHVAAVYDAEVATATLFYNFKNVADDVAIGMYRGKGNIILGRGLNSTTKHFEGKMHEVRLWSKKRTSGEMQINSLKNLNGTESGLLSYYPMSEGKGNIAFDKSRGANALISAEWSTPPGYAALFVGNSSLKLPSGSTIVVDKEMDYSIEFWFKADKGQANTTLLSNEIEQMPNESKNRFFIGFNADGKLVFRSNEGADNIIENRTKQDLRDDKWHHLAIVVNKTSLKVETYVDDLLITQFGTTNIGGIGSDYISVGAKRVIDNMNQESFKQYFKGSIDEVRFWNTALNREIITNNSNSRLCGEEMGLMAYYPFEEYITSPLNQKELKYSLTDMKVEANTSNAKAETLNVTGSSITAPIKDRGPVENLQYSYIVSDKSLMIKLEESMEVVEKSIVRFTVKNVQDQNGNYLKSPITWSAYIDRNLLKWDIDEISETIAISQPLELKATIVNSGGSIEKYSLENLPRWITASPEEGTISPKSKQVITFTVDDGLNVGAYNEIVYMRNSNNVTEPLALNIKVNGVKPDWSVDPAKFEYNMSVYGQLRISNIFSNDKEDVLAAFVNEECVGIANNIYNSKADKWYTFLTIYGNKADENASVEFRIWDASTGKIFLAQTTESIAFKNQRIYGTSSTPLIFDTSELFFQNFKLNKGWNWISFNVANQNLSNVQQTLGTNWNAADIVKNENHFDSFSSINKKWLGTLSQNKGFNNTSGFMLKTVTAKNMSVVGAEIDLKAVSIAVKGSTWNYISYLPTVNMTVDEALAGYAAQDGDIIKSQEGFSMFNGNTWIGSLNYMEPNKGYMLYRTAVDGVNFKYPSINGSLKSMKGYSVAASNDFVYRNYNYLNNMTVVAKVVGGVNLHPTDLLVAYVDGEKRGASQLNVESGENLYFTNVISDNAGSLRFGIEREGEIIARTGNIASYKIDSRKGDLDSPLELNFEASVDNLSVYPNPFKDQLNIRISLQQDSDVSINIYTLSGVLTKSYKPSILETGEHIKVWDASAQSNGLYIVSISVNGVISSFKVIKQ